MSPTLYKQIIVLRKDLNMRKGKMVAQGSHASVAGTILGCHFEGDPDEGGTMVVPLTPARRAWLEGRFAKIVVSVGSEAELLALHQKVLAAGLPSVLIQDAGLTEFGGVPTYTAISVGPAHKDDIDPLCGHLPLL
jgi:PTH2 family peptidyl-tRNA hydrolase